jgi:signal transduction histidine kinase
VLHDEVLPNLHTALLYLNEESAGPTEKQQAMNALAKAHREISDLMREMPLPLPHRLAQNGLAAAVKSLLEVDFAHQFSTVNLSIQPEAAQKARDLPLYIAEALYFAARELVRNAAAHGRGSQSERSLHLEVHFVLENELCLIIEDDGIGPQELDSPVESNPERKTSGSGNGLRIHSAVLAAVGAELEITTRPEGGTRAVIRVNFPTSNHS